MMPFARLFTRPRHETAVRAVYEAIVAAARHPRLYEAYGVPDTIDGRFDMIILHAVLLLDRLKSEGSEGFEFSQRLTDYLFADMDRSLREMGVGDLSVGKRVRTMASVFYGRARAYSPCLAAGAPGELAEALARNVFPDDPSPEGSKRLAEHALSLRENLRETPGGAILAGRVIFAEPSA
jgi:cytochrome b pre-mRNA-processing protein 3